MQNEDEMNFRLDPAERELEAALAGMRPKAARIGRDELMFEAGRQSGRRALRLWQSAAAVLVLAAGLSLVLRPAPRSSERIVYLPSRTPPDVSTVAARVTDIGPFSMARLQALVMEKGVEALPFVSSGAGAEPAHPSGATPSLRPIPPTHVLEGDPS